MGVACSCCFVVGVAGGFLNLVCCLLFGWRRGFGRSLLLFAFAWLLGDYRYRDRILNTKLRSLWYFIHKELGKRIKTIDNENSICIWI